MTPELLSRLIDGALIIAPTIWGILWRRRVARRAKLWTWGRAGWPQAQVLLDGQRVDFCVRAFEGDKGWVDVARLAKPAKPGAPPLENLMEVDERGRLRLYKFHGRVEVRLAANLDPAAKDQERGGSAENQAPGATTPDAGRGPGETGPGRA